MMNRVFSKMVRVWSLAGLMVLTQNCSPLKSTLIDPVAGAGNIQQNSLGAEADAADEVATEKEQDEGNQASEVPKIDPMICFRDYMTVFKWTNPDADITAEAPTYEMKKIATIKFLNGAPAPIPPSDNGWFLSGYVTVKSDGSTQSTVKFWKNNQTNPDESLDCALKRLGESNVAADPFANLIFQNMGLDQAANNVVGFLRSSEQFMACKVSKGNSNVEIKDADGTVLKLGANEPFILKRGCYQ
jgi:hypothetical protein